MLRDKTCSPGKAPLTTTVVAKITRQRVRRGAFSGAFNGIVDLQAAIKRFLKEHNADPKPFVWTKPAAEIFDKLARLPAPSD